MVTLSDTGRMKVERRVTLFCCSKGQVFNNLQQSLLNKRENFSVDVTEEQMLDEASSSRSLQLFRESGWVSLGELERSAPHCLSSSLPISAVTASTALPIRLPWSHSLLLGQMESLDPRPFPLGQEKARFHAEMFSHLTSIHW